MMHAMRFYLSSRSYPELREHPAGTWARGLVWLRAGRSAIRDRPFWWFMASQLGLILGGVVGSRVAWAVLVGSDPALVAPGTIEWYELAISMAIMWTGLILAGLVAASWGGDVLRPHLRAVDDHARTACPGCGHDLADRADWPADEVPCPECGQAVPTSVFREPFAIPRRFLSWGAARASKATPTG